MIGLLSILACGQVSEQAPEEVASPAPDLTRRPYGLACDYLREVQSGKYPQAYAGLSESLQRELTAQDFESRLAGWAGSEGALLASLAVRSEQVVGDNGRVEIGPDGQSGPPTWVLVYQKTGDRWRITSVIGQPFPPR